jgi:branched-chain amino acid transport system ATP-binding protein
MLDCVALSKAFGGTAALVDVDLGVAQGEIVGLIGPNGSGKSTLINVVSGFYKPDAGIVRVAGRVMTGASPQHLRRMGMARTFQNLRLFESMTVMDNVLVGLHPESVAGFGPIRTWFRAIVRTPDARRVERKNVAMAAEALRAFDLVDLAATRVKDLSYGLKKRVELARALVANPRLLLLDEPAAGLTTAEIEDLLAALSDYRETWAPAILLVEHRLELVLTVSDRVVVLDAGRKLADGTADEIARDENVIRAYIGG